MTRFPSCGAILTLAFASAAAFACECPRMQSFDEARASTDLIFFGEVIGITTGERDSEVACRPSSVWKGPKTDT